MGAIIDSGGAALTLFCGNLAGVCINTFLCSEACTDQMAAKAIKAGGHKVPVSASRFR